MRILTAVLAFLSAACAGTVTTPSATPRDAGAAPSPTPGASLVRFQPACGEDGVPALDGLSETGRLALKVLLETETFTSDAVGEGHEVPVQVEAFRLLFREDPADAAAAFRYLFDRGMDAGKLFGLCGLWFFEDPDVFAAACEEFAGGTDDWTVRMFEGCIIATRPVAGIVRHRGEGPVVRLRYRSQALRGWFEETGTKSAAFDIEGGGWPCILRGADARVP